MVHQRMLLKTKQALNTPHILELPKTRHIFIPTNDQFHFAFY